MSVRPTMLTWEETVAKYHPVGVPSYPELPPWSTKEPSDGEMDEPDVPAEFREAVPHIDLLAKATFEAKPELKIIDTYPICAWYYEGFDDDCTICMQSLMSLCANCESREGDTPARCAVLQGVCSHMVHDHCLQDYDQKSLCLVCRQPWKVQLEHALPT